MTTPEPEQKPEEHKPETVMLAAGGTGGHLFPAEALAQELLNRGHKVVIVTDSRGDAFKSLADKVNIHSVCAATFKAGLLNKITAIIAIVIGILQAAILLRKYNPGIIVGFGGYPSYPTMFAAQSMGFPTLLHEQNAILGKANQHLANRSIAIAASLPNTRGINTINEFKVTVTGNPVRAAISAVRERPYPVFSLTSTTPFEIFITGGSTALTRIFNETVPAALERLSEDIRKRVHVVHQCRAQEIAATEERYKAAGISAEIKSFFNDMPERLAACNLFIGRSGASTVAEIAVVGRPALFVPYQHADRQQFLNAEQITNKKGGWIMDQDNFTPATLGSLLERLIKDPAQLEGAAKAAKDCGQPDAVINLANLVETKLQNK